MKIMDTQKNFNNVSVSPRDANYLLNVLEHAEMWRALFFVKDPDFGH